MKKFLKVLKDIVLVIWQLPQDIVALVMYPFLGKKKLLKIEKGTRVYSGTNMRGGISLGNFIFVSEYLAKKPESIAHELGHCVDSKMMGWFYLFIIGIPSLCWAGFKPKEKCYYSFYTERRANKHAGLIVKENPYGCYVAFPEPEKAPEKPKKESLSSAIEKLARNK